MTDTSLVASRIMGDVDRLRRTDLETFHSDCLRLLNNDPDLVSVDVQSFVSLNEENAIRLAQALEHNTHLRRLSVCVSRDMTPYGTECLAKSILGNQANQNYRQITTLALRGNHSVPTWLKHRLFQMVASLQLQEFCLGIPIQDEDVECLYLAVRDNPIPKFSFRFDQHMSLLGAERLSNVISLCNEVQFCDLDDLDPNIQRVVCQRGIQRSNHVRSLTFETHMVGNIHALVDALPPLHALRVHECYDIGFGMQALSAGLQTATNLTVLQLTFCYFKDDKIIMLAQGFRHLAALEVLNLEQNYFGDEGVQALVECWPENSHLKTILLSSNHIGSRGAQQLLRAVAAHPTMERVDLSRNVQIGFTGLLSLAHEILPNVRLQMLGLAQCGCYLHDSKLTDEQRVARKRVSQAMSDAVPQNPHLRELLLQDEDVEPEVNATLQFMLHTRRNGLYLLSENHQLGPAVWCHVFGKHKEDASLIYFFVREQPALVVALSPNTTA